jgi:hypothetical protein
MSRRPTTAGSYVISMTAWPPPVEEGEEEGVEEGVAGERGRRDGPESASEGSLPAQNRATGVSYWQGVIRNTPGRSDIHRHGHRMDSPLSLEDSRYRQQGGQTMEALLDASAVGGR